MKLFQVGDVIYSNPLASEKDIDGFRMEGQACITFPGRKMRMENALDPALGQASNFVFWCPQQMPASFQATWQFQPIRDPGLAMFWFAAHGHDGKDLFDPSLKKRTGEYQQYFDSDMNAYHASYFRRKQDTERQFTTCNMRKSKGFHLVCQGADPMPSVQDVVGPYTITVTKADNQIQFKVNDLVSFEWEDDGKTYGPVWQGGYIGFRQMAPLIADYSNLEIRELDL